MRRTGLSALAELLAHINLHIKLVTLFRLSISCCNPF